MADQRQRSNLRRAGSARGRFSLGALTLLVVLFLASPLPAEAQEPTATTEPAAQVQDDGFFSFGFAEVLDLVALVVVLGFGVWLVRIQGARVEAARDQLEDQRKRHAEEIGNERRHTERLREQHAGAIDVLERQVELYKNQAGIESSGQIPAGGSELPEDARADLAEMLSVLKEMKDARQEEGPATAPSPAAAAEEHSSEGNAYFAAGNYREALTEYERSLELRPDDPGALTSHGAALGNLGRYDDALADFNRSLELRRDHPATLNNRGLALGNLGRYDDALTDFTRSLELRPDHPAALGNRGVALRKLGRYDDSLVAHNRSLELRPDHPHTLCNRARVYGLMNKPDEAIEDLRRAIAGDAKYRNEARTDSDFDSIRDDPRFQELVREGEPGREKEPAPEAAGGSE